MLNIKRILVPTDYSESAERAFIHGAFLADWHEAELHVLHVAETDIADEHMLRGEELLSEAELADQLNLALEEGPDFDQKRAFQVIQVREEAPSARDAIVHYIEENDIDLAVMGTHGRRGAERLIMGSTAEGVVRLSECPVLTVRAGIETSPRRTIERVLAPIDFSDATKPALAYAAELAQTYGARIDVLHVVPDAIPALAYGHHADTSFTQEWVEAAQERLAELIREEIGYEHAQATVATGHPVSEILEYARQEKSDMVVIPTHGRSGLERLLLGSVTEKVVRMAPCPVFTVKSYGKSLLPEPRAALKAER